MLIPTFPPVPKGRDQVRTPRRIRSHFPAEPGGGGRRSTENPPQADVSPLTPSLPTHSLESPGSGPASKQIPFPAPPRSSNGLPGAELALPHSHRNCSQFLAQIPPFPLDPPWNRSWMATWECFPPPALGAVNLFQINTKTPGSVQMAPSWRGKQAPIAAGCGSSAAQENSLLLFLLGEGMQLFPSRKQGQGGCMGAKIGAG